MSPNEILEIEGPKSDPVSPAPFDREKAKQMILNMHPDADIMTMEACQSLSVYRQVTKVPLPNVDSDIVQKIDDLLNEYEAPSTQ